MAAALGGLYAGACLVPGFGFLGGTFWRFVSLMTMGGLAFDLEKTALYPTAALGLISMALSSVVSELENGRIFSGFLAAGCVCALFYVVFMKKKRNEAFVPVELCYKEKQCCLTALRDTGNTLKDPVTGSSVLVVDADVAWELAGLTKEQLKKPVEAMERNPVPGLRLIPYRTVGQPAGMLLAIRVPKMRIGRWQGSGLVAFAPEMLSPDGKFQALAGGAL